MTGLTLYRVSSTGDDAVIPLSANHRSYSDQGLHFLSNYTYHLVAHAASASPDSASVTVHTGDAYPPALTISGPLNGTIYHVDAVEISWTASDNGSGVDGAFFRIDGQEWQQASGPTLDIVDSGDGNHTVELKVLDKAGNSATASVWFIIDTTHPPWSSTRRQGTAS